MTVLAVTLTGQTPLGSGFKLITGTVKASGSAAYARGGEYMNLSSYFKAAATPFVSFGGAANVTSSGWFTLAHDGGTANSGKVRLYGGTNVALVNDAVIQSEANTGLNITNMPSVRFMAIGEQF